MISLSCLYKGSAGPSAYIYTIHSQTTEIPDCPEGHTLLWSGYSLLHTEDDHRAHAQDLGKFFLFLPHLTQDLQNISSYLFKQYLSENMSLKERIYSI